MNGFLAGAVLVVATAAIVVILVMTARGRARSMPGKTAERAAPSVGGRPCPVCGALLPPGERVRSVLRLSQTRGRIMEISGCPRCLPPGTRRRACPVCKDDLGPKDFLTARYSDPSREGSRPHVHVLGCTRCLG